MNPDTSAERIEAPFDSDDYPKAVLACGDDYADTYCDACLRYADEFPGAAGRVYGAPCAMWNAAIYCADCMPDSYNEYDGTRVSTLTGAPAGG